MQSKNPICRRAHHSMPLVFLLLFSACPEASDTDASKKNDANSDAKTDASAVNQRPTAFFSASPTEGVVPLAVAFDGSQASDPDGDPLVYEWDFGDGATATGSHLVHHTYTTPGTYDPRLTVTDDQGLEAVFSLPIVARPDSMVTVPQIVGLTSTAAQNLIEGAGLTVGTTSHEQSDTVPLDHVISQQPAAGITVASGSSVSMVVSLGAATVAVPNVVDLMENAAVTAITDAGLTVGSRAEEHSATTTVGHIVRQQPTAGTEVSAGTAVDLVVSLGPANSVVPSIVGLVQPAAERALATAGLVVGAISVVASDSVPFGVVVNQNPAPGTPASPGDQVGFSVSSGDSNSLPEDPATVAPENDRTVATTAADYSFLFQGEDPVQVGMRPGTIDSKRMAILRGKVFTKDMTPLAGVTIAILNQEEFGLTRSRADGLFDLVVNGGAVVTVSYEKQGYLPAQRQIATPWQDFAWLPDVVLLTLDPQVTEIDFSEPMAVAQCSVVSDNSGTRQATLLCPQGVSAEMILPDGSSQQLGSIGVRATEYTVGDNGPLAMPGDLPPTTGYTYAVEYSVDQAIAADAKRVEFSAPLWHYVENFLNFPVGSPVPTGYYDRELGHWLPSQNGLVIKIVAVTGGIAQLDTDGDDVADGQEVLDGLSVTAEEQQQLATLYQPEQTLWRVPIEHFTPFDCNWPFSPPGGSGPPGLPEPEPEEEEDPCEDDTRCIIEFQNQILRETIPIAGTPFSLNYRSERVGGYKVDYTLNIALTNETYPDPLKRIELVVAVAGREFLESFAPEPNLSHQFTWDGYDAYGRKLQGSQPVQLRIGYVYDAVYEAPAVDVVAVFGQYPPGDLEFVNTTTRQEMIMWQRLAASIGPWEALALGMGGWSIDVHHVYGQVDRALHLGDGTRHSGQAIAPVIDHVAGGGTFYNDYGDGVPASQIRTHPKAIAAGPDGSLYVFETQRLNRIDSQGIIRTIAGQYSVIGFGGDGGPATEAIFGEVSAIDVADDGSIYIADMGNHRIRKIDTNGIITTVAGNGNADDSGDQGLATIAGVQSPQDIAVAADGSFYIAQPANLKVRRVTAGGIITTVAGGPTSTFALGEGGPAQEAYVKASSIDVGPDGNLFILCQRHRLRKVSFDGTITTVGGSGTPGASGDGGPAVDATITVNPDLGKADKISVATDGSIYLTQSISYDSRLRVIDSSGNIETLVGKVPDVNAVDFGNGGVASAAVVEEPRDVAVTADGRVYLMERSYIRSIAKATPSLSSNSVLFPSRDTSEIFILDLTGRHLRTVEGLTGAVRYIFDYDDAGLLVAITDANNLVTEFERLATGELVAITGPYGQRTEIGLNASGYIQTVTDPSSSVWSMGYGNGGLLTSFTNPNIEVTGYTYDELGRLVREDDPAGGSLDLERVELENGYHVPATTAEQHTNDYLVENISGMSRHTTIFADSTQNVSEIGSDGTAQLTLADGRIVNVTKKPDARFGMLASYTSAYTEETPQRGLIFTYSQTRSFADGEDADILLPAAITHTQVANGLTYQMHYDRESQTVTRTTPEGRQIATVLDALGRPVAYHAPGIAGLFFEYDGQGRISHMRLGTGVDAREYTILYNQQGHIQTISNPLQQDYGHSTDAVGRLVSLTLPDSQHIDLSYDNHGNLLSLTPPERPAHVFSYNQVNRLSTYDPPDVTDSTAPSVFGYNADRQLTLMTDAGSRTIAYNYDQGGRLDNVVIARGVIQYQYDPNTGQMANVTTPDTSLTFTYDGTLITDMVWEGTVPGSVAIHHDNFFRRASIAVNNEHTTAYSYDNDGLLTQVGSLTVDRDSESGLVTGTTSGNVTDEMMYNGFGEVIGYSCSFESNQLLDWGLSRDALGRIVEKDMVTPSTEVLAYSYDINGRLETVTRDGVTIATYAYDGNGNRISETDAGGQETISTYDDQDRLLSRGSTTYSYGADGSLASKNETAGLSSYTYDELGNLIEATLPDGTELEYIIDGRNRRIGKKVNDTLAQGFLYQDKLNPIAELDGGGTVVSRFIYGTRANVPDYMIRDDQTYRIISDQVGSPLLVIETLTGNIAQRIEYDAFGKPQFLEGDPGFQPFGFAGGIYDRHTGLVRFGSRDYDPDTGRFTAKDPVLFNSGAANLYTYLGNDPINLVDPSGMGSDDPCSDGEGDCNGRNNQGDERERFRVEARWRESTISFSVPSWADTVIGLIGATMGTGSQIGIAAELGGAGSVLGVAAYPIAFEGARQSADQLAETLIEDRVNRDMQQLDEMWRDINRSSDHSSDDCP